MKAPTKAVLQLAAAALVGVASLALGASYGCSQSSDDGADNTEDKLVGFQGNVDHAAIVESGTILLTVTSNPLLDSTLDAYNQEDPFAVSKTTYADTFAKNLAKFDAIDGKTDWTPELSKKWLARIKSNYQIIDTSKPCDFSDQHSYLEIERAMLTGTDHKTCGGRMPNEDALDVTMNFLARGPVASMLDADAFSDGIDQATQKSNATFPYLAELNQ